MFYRPWKKLYANFLLLTQVKKQNYCCLRGLIRIQTLCLINGAFETHLTNFPSLIVTGSGHPASPSFDSFKKTELKKFSLGVCYSINIAPLGAMRHIELCMIAHPTFKTFMKLEENVSNKQNEGKKCTTWWSMLTQSMTLYSCLSLSASLMQ